MRLIFLGGAKNEEPSSAIVVRRGRSRPYRVRAVDGSDRLVFDCGHEGSGTSDQQRLRERGEQPKYSDINFGKGRNSSPEEEETGRLWHDQPRQVLAECTVTVLLPDEVPFRRLRGK